MISRHELTKDLEHDTDLDSSSREHSEKIDRSLSTSILEGSWWAVMFGFGESYIGAFGEYLKASLLQISMLTTIPVLVSSLSQLLALRLTIFFSTRKRMGAIAVFSQAGVWLLIIVLTYWTRSVVVLIILVGLYHIFGSLSIPAWASWMGDLVPENSRGRYFGRRNRILGLISFLSLSCAGIILNWLSQFDTFLGFIVLFTIAFFSRTVSGLLLLTQYEPDREMNEQSNYSFVQFLRTILDNNYGYFSFYTMLMMFAISLLQPLIVVYWLRIFHFSYFQFMTVIAVNSISNFSTVIYWGKRIDRVGIKKVFRASSYIVSLLPFLLFALNYLPAPYVYPATLLIQVLSGIGWSGFLLSSSNFLYELVPSIDRIPYMSYNTALKGIAVFLGGVAGSQMASLDLTSIGLMTELHLPILASGILRLAFTFFLVHRINEL